MGYTLANGTPSAVTNGFGGLEPVLISQTEMTRGAVARTASSPPICPPGATRSRAGNLPRPTPPPPPHTSKSSLVVYDNLGNEVLLDVYFTKTGANTWEVAVFDQSNAAPGTSFPYTAGPLASPDADFRPHDRQAHRRERQQHHHPGAERRAFNARPGQAPRQLATGYTVLRLAGRRQRAERHRQDRDRRGRHHLRAIRERLVQGALPHSDRHVQSPDQLNVEPGNVYSQSSRIRRHPHRLCQ